MIISKGNEQLQPADSPACLSASPSWFLHVLSASLICLFLFAFLTVPMMAATDTSWGCSDDVGPPSQRRFTCWIRSDC
ncbi:hypothetical protein HanRHA438_Chr12g0544851 [Helianthus annuus]|nr:hypothetical protein HanOQP8_Chr12g0440441 [Helianthus annuus]KAJ0865835.1 hypothetical protein HanRHA438_Chr12g0544851 [Helianthus annuus]